MKKITRTVSWTAAVAVVSCLALVAPVFAETNVKVGLGANIGVSVPGGMHNDNDNDNDAGVNGGIFGTVSGVNGNTVTMTSQAYARPLRPMPEQSEKKNMPMMQAATTTYTVDATNAKIYKGSATTTVSVSAIGVGDKIVAQGAVSGTNITATVIHDGFPVPTMIGGPGPRKFFGHDASSTPSGTPIIQGNGEPVIGGKVTVVSGTTITVTNASNVTYTIAAASSTFIKNGTSTAIGTIAVGDTLIVQGVVNGNSVTASSILDEGVKASSTNTSSSAPHGKGLGVGLGAGIGGFFGAIGGFFQHLFGF